MSRRKIGIAIGLSLLIIFFGIYVAISIFHVDDRLSPPSATNRLPGNGSVHGQILLGPVCPVEQNPPDPACAPKQYKGTVEIKSLSTGTTYKPVTTDSAGEFDLSLAPGSYELKVSKASNSSPFPQCSAVEILVIANKSQAVTMNCDTGIR